MIEWLNMYICCKQKALFLPKINVSEQRNWKTYSEQMGPAWDLFNIKNSN